MDQKGVVTGFLTKEGGSWKSWKRRYFVLDVDKARLSYFKKESVCPRFFSLQH